MTDKQQIVLDIVAKISKRSPAQITPGSQLVADLGLDSPKQLQLLNDLEQSLGLEIEDEDAARMNTVGDILKFVASK